MIELPDKTYSNVFDGEVKRGTILKTLLLCHDGTEKPHYYITVSHNTETDPLVFVIATSKLDFYNKYPHFNKDILRIPKNKIQCFPLETIINCRKIFTISREKLKDSYKENTLQFCGELLVEDLREIDDIIRKSRFIPNNDKKLILGESL